MTTTLTAAGQVTIPTGVRDALHRAPGDAVEFAINEAGEVVLRKASRKSGIKRDRFEAMQGSAQIKWNTRELMSLLRG